MNYLIIFIGLLSLLDLYCTLKWININPYMEANPIMRCLWTMNPVIFVLFKVVVTLVFCLIAFKFKDNRLLGRLIWLPFCVYVLVVFVHLSGLQYKEVCEWPVWAVFLLN